MRTNLVHWFEDNKRPLPWRKSPSLYATVVSEFMLQQTQVKTVLPYWNRWMERFPDFRALAEAEETVVLKHWEGLGYYSRARNLHQLARKILDLDPIPRDTASWRQFKGVGPYTAAAITSIAFDTPAACVDGNIIRILSRVSGDETPIKNNSQALKRYTPLAQAWLDPARPGLHNEALMELGATVCTKGNPKCEVCPLGSICRARNHDPERLPRKIPPKITKVLCHRAWVERDGCLLLCRADARSRRLAEILELPTLQAIGFPLERLPQRLSAGDLSAPIPDAQEGGPIATRKRGIGNTRITEHIWDVPPGTIEANCKQLHWIPFDQLENETLSGPHKRWIKEILQARPS